MKVSWLGVSLVAVLAVCVLLLKSGTRHNTASKTVNGTPAVILVADFSEADDPNDRCSVIIHAVRDASKRGIQVAELSSDSKSDLLHRYRVLTVPTVLLLDDSGKEIGRFEGEDAATVVAIQSRLSALVRTHR